MEENGLQNKSILENNIQLQDSETENEADFNNGSSEKADTQEETDYVFTYSGQAMNMQELFQFSAHEELELVLVAGPFHSGKTTLETMLYYVFLEGRNKKLNFGGSYTIRGFKKRTEKILYSSGEPEPVIGRTLFKDTDCFLHLRVCDETGQSQNLIFADLPGEIFEKTGYIEDYREIFEDVENVIVIIDGKKACDVKERKNVYMETIIMIKMFLNNGIITRNTKLQIVCTKLDEIQESKNYIEVEQFLETKRIELFKLFEHEVFSIHYYMTSALQIEEECESEKLEKIMCKCMESVPKLEKKIAWENTLEKVRQFEYFGIRG